MKRIIFLCLIVLMCLFMSQFTYGTSSTDIIAGPENQGLRMKLRINNADISKPDIYKVSINLINVGTTPVSLIAQSTPWEEKDENGDYSEFVKKHLIFTSFPKVCVDSAQTMGSMKKISSQPTLVIKPGESMFVEWVSAYRRLKPEGYYNTTPVAFPSDGLYNIRAEFIAVSKEGKRILLYSNDCQLAVGGSTKLPKFSVARIVRCDPVNGTVLLDLGADHQIKPDDKFRTSYFPYASWEIVITEVKDTVSIGLVKTVARDPSGENVPVFPEEGWSADLVINPPKTAWVRPTHKF